MTNAGLCVTILRLSGAPYRGVEQLEARRAHNPEVVGSSPASATIKIPGIHYEYRVFSNFLAQNGTYQILFDTNFDTNAGSNLLHIDGCKNESCAYIRDVTDK